jgi:hypothetical protein
MFVASHLACVKYIRLAYTSTLHSYHILLPPPQSIDLTYGDMKPDGSKQLLTVRDTRKHLDDLRLVSLSLLLP